MLQMTRSSIQPYLVHCSDSNDDLVAQLAINRNSFKYYSNCVTQRYFARELAEFDICLLQRLRHHIVVVYFRVIGADD